MIPLAVPSIEGNAWRYVKECLDTGWVSTAGAFVTRFEETCRRYVGSRHAVACASGTASLHVALRLVGVAPGDEVIVPTVTFIAPVNTIRYLGADPVFMDCDDFYNIDAAKTLEFLARETTHQDGHLRNRQTGRRIAALLAVHVLGNAAHLDPLVAACRERGLPLIEDATESLGTVYRDGMLAGRHTGTIGDIGCFSFNGNKIITTGGGGMLVTDDDAHAAAARYLTTQAKDDEVRYVHDEVGYNYRLTNLQAAVGVAQFEQLPTFVERKRRIYETYRAELADVPGLQVAAVPSAADNNCWLSAVQIDAARYGRDRERLLADLAAQQVQARPLWQLNHLQRPYRRCSAYRIERAHDLHARTLTIPSSVSLTPEQQRAVVAALRS